MLNQIVRNKLFDILQRVNKWQLFDWIVNDTSQYLESINFVLTNKKCFKNH